MIINAEAIKDNVSMAEVCAHLGHEVNRKSRCSCPIHQGDKPNFKTRGRYGTCFSDCGGVSFDHVEVLIQLRGYTYPEAIEELARIGGLEVERSESRSAEEVARYHEEAKYRDALRDNLKSALHLYKRPQPKPGGKIIDIEGRKLHHETVQAFDLMISPPGNILVDAARKGRADETYLQDLGLIRLSKQGSGMYDAFKDRVLFPIQDHHGKLVGLAGRVTSTNKSRAKYINSHESEIFEKGNLLYGLAQNRKNIAASGAILVEGYWDVLTCYDQGIRRCVASMGTSVTRRQVDLLHRYTEEVTIMMDGDEAGQKAARASAELFMEAGFEVKLLALPVDEDADDYLRTDPTAAGKLTTRLKHAPPAYEQILNYYLISGDLTRDEGLRAVAELYASIDHDYRRMQCEGMLEQLLDKKELKLWKDRVANVQERKREEDQRPRYSPEEYAQIISYQIYERRNRVYATTSPDKSGVPISNFTIRPVMMVLGRENSTCLVELRNIQGASTICEISTDSMTELGPFKKVLLSKGNFLFDEAVKPHHFVRIQRWLFDAIRHCYPLTTLGYNGRGGFYAWANGLATEGDGFRQVDEYGIVEHGGHRYYLPAFSSAHNTNPGDDEVTGYENMRGFKLATTGQAPSMLDWSRLFVQVHGDNGMVGLAFYFTCLFRSHIFGMFDVFPLLNLFGPPGLGKSFMAGSIAALFGEPQKPFNLHEGTDVGLFRRVAQKRDAVVVLEEFNNMIHPKRFQALKNFYDGSGREKGQRTMDNRTTTTRVESGIVMVGQQQPTQDAALFSRVVSLNFGPRDFTPEQLQRAQELKAIETSGILSQLTTKLLKHREHITKKFLVTYEGISSRLRRQVPPNAPRNIAPRLVKNNAIILAVFTLISEVEQLAIKPDQLEGVMIRVMVSQLFSIAQEDDLAGWWDQIEFAISRGDLRYEQELSVASERDLKVEQTNTEGSAKQEYDWSMAPRKVLYLHMTVAFQVYSQNLRKSGRDNGMPKSSIQHYLRGSEAYLGEKVYKMGGRSKRVYCFDVSRLPFDLQTDHEKSRGMMPGSGDDPNAVPAAAGGDGQPFDPAGEDLPF